MISKAIIFSWLPGSKIRFPDFSRCSRVGGNHVASFQKKFPKMNRQILRGTRSFMRSKTCRRSCGQAHSPAQSPSLRSALISRYYWDRGVPVEIAPRHWETRHPATPFASPLDSLLSRPLWSISNSANLSFNKALLVRPAHRGSFGGGWALPSV